MAVLQASGQVPREDERARNGASGLCETVGCPYAARAAYEQPFCLALRGGAAARARGARSAGLTCAAECFATQKNRQSRVAASGGFEGS